MAVCMIPNCRKVAPSDEAFCVDHRDRPSLSSRRRCGLSRQAIDARLDEPEQVDALLVAFQDAVRRLRRARGHLQKGYPLLEQDLDAFLDRHRGSPAS